MTSTSSTFRSPPTSEGCRLLREVPLTSYKLARELGVGGETVRRWRLGTSRPGRARRLRLAAVLSVPLGAWCLPAAEAAEASPEASMRRLGRSLMAAADLLPTSAPASVAELDGLVDACLFEVRRIGSDLSSRTRFTARAIELLEAREGLCA